MKIVATIKRTVSAEHTGIAIKAVSVTLGSTGKGKRRKQAEWCLWRFSIVESPVHCSQFNSVILFFWRSYHKVTFYFQYISFFVWYEIVWHQWRLMKIRKMTRLVNKKWWRCDRYPLNTRKTNLVLFLIYSYVTVSFWLCKKN